ncbi:poly(U)-specific endoribonuclease [Mytilus galloprovincialis]|uniref:Poly(U)-specific endoribonuclease n=1 Tax=Mytilus galloprovincialis TaxID=29158 RepID=A0A8B6CE62_MYTGA|nr:poly(U)-specific endoribonuclease [Mytilus galloprovincialis]
MARLIQHSLVLTVLLLHGRVCLGGNCSCLNADELPHNDDDEYHKKCLSSCPMCSEDYAFIYKFSVIESCVGKCGQRYDESLPCQCNTACTLPKYNNCCDDYKAFCLIESCAGKCEQLYNPHLKCQCNKACKGQKDCCDDYDDFCSEEAKNIDSVEGDEDATQFCPGIVSFIQWDPSTSCINFDQLKENWTGIMRSREMLETSTAPDDEDDKWKPLQCKIKNGETSEDLMLVKSSSNNCNDLMSFYCKNGSEPQKSKTTIMEEQENNVTMSFEFDVNTPSLPNTSNMMTGVIVGTVSSIIAIGVVIVAVIVCRRRRSVGRKPDHKQDAHRQNETEKIGHSENKNDYAYSEIEMEATNKKDHVDNGDNEYTTGPSDVYDHLNENKNRQIKTENPHAIYDHATGDNAESDYDSTKHVVPTNPDYQEVIIRSEEEINSEKL